VRYVADETGRAGLAPDDLRPLVPLWRATAGQEKIEERVGALTGAQPHERPDRSDFVGGVGVPGGMPLTPTLSRREREKTAELGLLVVALEVRRSSRWQEVPRRPGRARSSSRSDEIGELGGAGT
jgi:hypothetical protein